MPALDLREPARAQRLALGAPPSGALLASAVATWRGRMVNEHGSAHVFEALAAQLAAAGLPVRDVAECRGFAAEERRHGVLCGAVVEALGGEARAEIRAPEAVPAHDDAPSALEAALRNVLSVCCLSETVAVALIGAERLEMPEGELRELLTSIWADEVGHARFGWRLLERVAPALDGAAREGLGDYLEVAFEHLVAHELAHLPADVAPPAFGEVYGLCSGKDARVLFFDTVTDVIVPGLEAHGIPASRAWARARRHVAA
jgi:hypothetical protein